MIVFGTERLHEVAGEADALLRLHYEELTLNKDRVKLDPMWQRYAELERLGVLHVYTARDGSELVGYAAFFVQPHLHYADLSAAINDVLFLHPDHRQGMTGIRFLKHCEAQLKTLGAHKIVWHAKLSTSLIPILGRLGYITEEVSLGKLL
jgi:GNAT superfamily N-acetyltransferase